MPFSSIVAYFTNNSAFKKLSQVQNEALVKVLAYAQAIDGEVAESERQILVKATKGLNWQGAFSLEEFVVRAVNEAYALIYDPAMRQGYVNKIGQELGEDWLREEAYYMAAKITLSDGDLQESEQALLRGIVEGFMISPARLATITELLIRDNVF